MIDALMILHVNYMWSCRDTINRNFVEINNRHYYFDLLSIDEVTIDNTIDNFYLIFDRNCSDMLIHRFSYRFFPIKKFPLLDHLLEFLSNHFWSVKLYETWLKLVELFLLFGIFIYTCFNKKAYIDNPY